MSKAELSEQWFDLLDKLEPLTEVDKEDLAQMVRSKPFMKAAKVLLEAANAKKDTLLTVNLLNQEGVMRAMGIQASVQATVGVFSELLSLTIFKEEKDEQVP